MSEATKIIGSNIRSRREELRLPSVELANQLGRSQATISRMENGKIEITISQLVKIADILKTTPAQLFPFFDCDMPQPKPVQFDDVNECLSGEMPGNGISGMAPSNS